MIYHLKKYTVEDNSGKITLRCPSCRQIGTFDAFSSKTVRDLSEGNRFGQRRCPNPDCHAHIFAIWDTSGKLLKSYPVELIDFDPSDVPNGIIKTFEEALICHSNNAFTASAIMIRRTLEEICKDKNASGDNLKNRIQALGSNVILPPALLQGLDNLRLLGNDAAHIEANTFKKIGEDEIEVAIEVTKEVLKAVYQMDSIVGRLEKLKSKKSQ